jgi:hypothetical protein
MAGGRRHASPPPAEIAVSPKAAPHPGRPRAMIGNVRRKSLNRPDILQHPTVVFEPIYVIFDRSIYRFLS